MKFNYLLLFAVFVSCSVFAGSGKAIIPHWSGDINGGASTYIYLSNVTDNTLNVKVTFFDDNGIEVSAYTVGNLINNNTQLAANSTAIINVRPPSRRTGYGVIEWSNLYGDNDTVGVVAYAERIVVNNGTRRADIAVPVNQGLPF